MDVSPRCDAKIALADAVVALTAKMAIQRSQTKGQHGFVQFEPAWFDLNHDAVPETTLMPRNAPTVNSETQSLTRP